MDISHCFDLDNRTSLDGSTFVDYIQVGTVARID